MLSTFTDYGYIGVFAALILSGFGLPIPEELPVLTAGGLCGHAETELRWYIMLPVCILGVVIGDGVLYTIGRLWGPKLLANAWVQRKLVPPETRAKIEKGFHDRGILLLLGARLTPGVRSPIFIMAGVLRVPLARFLLADGLYAVPGVSLMFFFAYFFIDQAMAVFEKLDHYRPFIIVGVLSFVGGIFAHRFLISRHVATGEKSEVPLINKPIEKVSEAATHAVEATAHLAGKTIAAVTHLGHSEKPPAEAAPPS